MMCHGGHRHGRFGRHGFPTREEWVERLEAHRDRLEADLANVRDLLERLRDGETPPEGAAT